MIRSSILGQIPLSGGYRVLSRSKTQVVMCPKRARNASMDGSRNSAGAIKGAIAMHWIYPPTSRLRDVRGAYRLAAAL